MEQVYDVIIQGKQREIESLQDLLASMRRDYDKLLCEYDKLLTKLKEYEDL